jgi:hypothetical protein
MKKAIIKVKNKILKQRLLFSMALIFSGIVIGVGFIIDLCLENYINFGTLNFEHSAHAGDFIGGVVGTIFTLVGIVLLYETLSLQRNEFEESRKVFEKQQFENKFFSLLHLYKEIISTFHYDLPTSSQKYVGKEFFAKHKSDFVNSYLPTNSYFKNRKIATSKYIEFYLSNKEELGQYFRTLYRLFKLIKDSKNAENEKIEYIKIVRGQLSESELFFINYNASTDIGKNFRPLVIYYNIIKHLPLLEKVEFKSWKSKLTFEKINSVSIVFDELLTFIKSHKSNFHKVYLKGRFDLRVYKNDVKIELELLRNNNVFYSSHLQEGFGLDDFTNDELESLLKFWALETFDFRKYPEKPNNNLQINVNVKPNGNQKSIIKCEISNKDNSQIEL